jgi:hypothetical protein
VHPGALSLLSNPTVLSKLMDNFDASLLAAVGQANLATTAKEATLVAAIACCQ